MSASTSSRAPSYLLSTFKLGDLILRNRVVMAPLTRGRCDPGSRVPNALMKEYYQQRASAGLIISEAVAVCPQGFGWNSAPACYNQEQASGWKMITDAVHAKGGVMFMQLWHMGRQSHSSFHDTKEVVSASDLPVGQGRVYGADGKKYNYEVPRALGLDEIPGVVGHYRHACILAKSAGFDGVEIHAANGYLIDQFLQSVSNKRTDAYGGSPQNRYRFLEEVVEACKSVYPPHRIGVRLSPNGVYGGMGSEDNVETFRFIGQALRTHGLAYIHLLDSTGFGYHEKCRPVNLLDFKQWYGGVLVGNIEYNRDSADGAIRSGAADLISFGRPYISNPDLVERFAHDWPLNPDADIRGWYRGGAKGYIDYPTYKQSSL